MTRGEYLYRKRWGVLLHFLSDLFPGAMTLDRWNRIVDGFDVEKLGDQLEKAGAGYLMLAAGQNSGWFCSPNPVYESICGIGPRCSRRDLIRDAALALERRGIGLLVYLPANPPMLVPEIVEAFGFHDPLSWSGRQAEFQRRWEAVIRHWALAWGGLIKGWWIDGCYFDTCDKLYRHPDAPNFTSFAASLRSGNPEALIAWNPGVADPELFTVCDDEDYTAGECQNPGSVAVLGRFEGQAQSHVLSYAADWWGVGKPRFTPDEIVAASANITRHGGVITWDVPFEPDGSISEAFLTLLAAVGASQSELRRLPDLPERLEARPSLSPLDRLKGSLSENQNQGSLAFTLANTRARTIVNRLELHGDGVAAEPAVCRVELAPGEKRELEFRLTPAPGIREAHLRIDNGFRSFQLRLPVRRRFNLESPLEADFVGDAGERIGMLRLKRDGKLLEFEVHARDDLRLAGQRLHDGSCVELFGAADGAPLIRQLFAIPARPGTLWRYRDYRAEPVTGSSLESRRTPDGFELHGTLPAAALALPDGGFFEAALHTGIGKEMTYRTLFSSPAPLNDTSYYARTE